jgi:hypothetical protein
LAPFAVAVRDVLDAVVAALPFAPAFAAVVFAVPAFAGADFDAAVVLDAARLVAVPAASADSSVAAVVALVALVAMRLNLFLTVAAGARARTGGVCVAIR